MGLGMLAWVHGRAWAANSRHLVPAAIVDKPRPPGLTHSIFAAVVKDSVKRGAKRQEAAAAANSPKREKAAAELLPHEKPQL